MHVFIKKVKTCLFVQKQLFCAELFYIFAKQMFKHSIINL